MKRERRRLLLFKVEKLQSCQGIPGRIRFVLSEVNKMELLASDDLTMTNAGVATWRMQQRFGCFNIVNLFCYLSTYTRL